MVWAIIRGKSYVGETSKSMKGVELAASQKDGWRNIPISNNVGGVKHFSSTRRHVLAEERHFALVEAFAFALPTKARLQSVSVRNSVRPIHLFDRNFDHRSEEHTS